LYRFDGGRDGGMSVTDSLGEREESEEGNMNAGSEIARTLREKGVSLGNGQRMMLEGDLPAVDEDGRWSLSQRERESGEGDDGMEEHGDDTGYEWRSSDGSPPSSKQAAGRRDERTRKGDEEG
jgi:hypothetical protein